MNSKTDTSRKIVVIGGGAAGFFAAITAAEADPSAEVVVYEKGHAFQQWRNGYS
jgi:succinate dehydrogenase/fumarate reductase flavoprotein subunit